MGKALKGNEMTARELSIIIDIANLMHTYVKEYDYNKSVKKELINLKKEKSGVILFFLANVLGFDPARYYRPADIKNKFETHMGWKTEGIDGRKSINSRKINRALILLNKKFNINYVTLDKRQIKELKRMQDIHFDGYPRVIKVPKATVLVNTILSKPKVFRLIYDALLESGLLLNFWKCQFMTILGCLQQVDDYDFQLAAQNLYAAIPEKVKDKPKLATYVQLVASLRTSIATKNDTEIDPIADKMAEYVIRNQPAFSVFCTHIQV